MSKPVLIYYDLLRYVPAVRAFMDEHFEVVTLPTPAQDTPEVLSRAEALLAPLGYPVGADKMARCPKLKCIASSTLSVPHLDLAAAAARGIGVVYLSEAEKGLLATVTPTAELCWALIIALTRHIPQAHRAVCAGGWDGRHFGRLTPKMLSSMTLGIIGLGRLGSLTAARGLAFGMEVLYYSPRSSNPAYGRCATLLELAGRADIVSMHAHLTPETEGMCDAAFFAAMRPGAYFINTGRGGLVDEAALLAALRSGHLAGAATDVLADEYRPDFRERLPENPLVQYARTHDHLIITPHYAGATVDAWGATQMRTMELLVEHFGGKR
jgi:D-3-phosphoglycerate dehydrogenase